MKLYQIKENYLKFIAQIENNEIEPEYIHDTLESIEDELQDKIDNIACYIKELEAEAKAIKEESIKLNERATDKLLKAKYFTEYIQTIMEQTNLKKVETSRNLIQIKKNPASVVLSDEFMDWARNNYIDLIRVKTIEEPDKIKIKEYLLNNKCEFAKLEQKEKITIK